MNKNLLHYSTSVLRIAMVAGLALTAPLVAAQDEQAGTQRAVPVAGNVARPSDEEIINNPILRNALSRSSDGLVFRRAPNGSVSVDLQGRFQNVSVARIGDDGEIEVACLTNHDSLAAFLTAHPEASEDDFNVQSSENNSGGHRDDQ